jgi:hypothetical protein
MTQSTYQAAMQASLDHDALDSVSPFDFEAERGDEWPTPTPFDWRFEVAFRKSPSVWKRILGWVAGE